MRARPPVACLQSCRTQKQCLRCFLDTEHPIHHLVTALPQHFPRGRYVGIPLGRVHILRVGGRTKGATAADLALVGGGYHHVGVSDGLADPYPAHCDN